MLQTQNTGYKKAGTIFNNFRTKSGRYQDIHWDPSIPYYARKETGKYKGAKATGNKHIKTAAQPFVKLTHLSNINC
jgi:hypothetical protein